LPGCVERASWVDRSATVVGDLQMLLTPELSCST
jgi:hypothetical protein